MYDSDSNMSSDSDLIGLNDDDEIIVKSEEEDRSDADATSIESKTNWLDESKVTVKDEPTSEESADESDIESQVSVEDNVSIKSEEDDQPAHSQDSRHITGQFSGVNDSETEDESQKNDRTEIRKELSALTFEELLALKAKLGTKEYNEAMFGPQNHGLSGSSKSSKQRKFKRENKNRPKETSSKIYAPKIREVVHVSQKRRRDPRFENLCGNLNEKIWNTNYSFLRDMAKEEQKNLKQKFNEDKNLGDVQKEKIRQYLNRLSNKERSNLKKEDDERKRRLEKKEQIEKLKQGKQPYFMKKSTRKYVELAEKYDQLKAQGKVESYLKKKRARNASRDKKSLKLK